MSKRVSERGFTLVELAVVIVVIGLIIGAVIKGQDMIETARVNAVINQVNGYRSAITAFQEKYGALPGDFAQAQARIPGCQAAGSNCANGDGNGLINDSQQMNTAAAGNENRMAWQHLAMANTITGVVPGADTADSEYGKNFPGARTGGGFVFLTSSVGTPASTGLWLRLQTPRGDQAVETTEGKGAVSPIVAAMVDRKIDDGNPNTGTVRAGGVATTCMLEEGAYDETVSSKDCNLYFQIN